MHKQVRQITVLLQSEEKRLEFVWFPLVHCTATTSHPCCPIRGRWVILILQKRWFALNRTFSVISQGKFQSYRMQFRLWFCFGTLSSLRLPIQRQCFLIEELKCLWVPMDVFRFYLLLTKMAWQDFVSVTRSQHFKESHQIKIEYIHSSGWLWF